MSHRSGIKKVKFSKDDFELLYKDFLKFRSDELDVIYSKSGLKKLNAIDLPHHGANRIHIKNPNIGIWYSIPNSKIILSSIENDYEIDTVLLHSLFIKNKIQIEEMVLNCYSYLNYFYKGQVTSAYLETLTVNYIHSSK